MEAKRGNIVFAIGKGKCFMKRKTICFLAAFGAILGGSMLFGGTASAEEAEVTDVPVATEVTEVTVPAVENSGWQEEDGVRRYYDESGNFLTGEQEIDGAYYLFDYDGVQKTGWRSENSVTRVLTAGGITIRKPETSSAAGWITAITGIIQMQTPARKPENCKTAKNGICWTQKPDSSNWGCAHFRITLFRIMMQTANQFPAG